MNFFELFGIPVQLTVNTGNLSQKFFELSKKNHPDYFINATDEIQADALEISSQVNKAWKTFQDKDQTIKYVLQLKGLLEEEEKYELPPDFLMEVLEINEALMEMEESRMPAIETRINELQSEIYEPVKDTVENYKEGSTTEKELLQVKAYYYKKKYLDRIRHQLKGMA